MSNRVTAEYLRLATRKLLERVELREKFVVTVNGRDDALLSPLVSRPLAVPKDVILDRLRRVQTDPDLTSDLEELASDMTDDSDDLG